MDEIEDEVALLENLQNGESEQTQIQNGGEVEVQDKEINRAPILICDNILMSNYFVKGVERAQEIKKFEEIDQCKNIKNSCCDRKDLDKSFARFNHTQIPMIMKKYEVLNKILRFLVENYTVFVKHAYQIQSLSKLNPVCKLASKNLIFTPINTLFIERFKE